MSQVVSLSDFNVCGIKHNIKKNLLYCINNNDLTDFNNRLVCAENLNGILNICYFLKMEDVIDFIIKYSIPSDAYVLDKKWEFIYPIPKYMLTFDALDICVKGDLKWLQYWKQDNEWYGCTTYILAKYGHLKCLQWVHENGCPWHNDTVYEAYMHNKIQCYNYAKENGTPNNMKNMVETPEP
jgi:hypothetical protein